MRLPAPAALLLLSACALSPASMAFEAKGEREDARPPSLAEPSTPAAPPQADRQVITTAALALQVADPGAAERDILGRLKEKGGWLQQLEPPRLVLRVPVARFEELFAELTGLGVVISKRISAHDVTDSFRDLKVRLEVADAIRARLVKLLEMAKKVEEALLVEKELARVTEEIERLKAQIAALQSQIAYATIAVELRLTLPPAVREFRFPFPWVRSLGVDPLTRF